MKPLWIFLLSSMFIFPINVHAAFINQIPSFQGSEYTWSPTELANQVILHCSSNITNAYCGLTAPNASTNYQVPVGKTLVIKYVRATVENATGYGSLCYGTSSTIGNGTTTPPTGLFRMSGLDPIANAFGVFIAIAGTVINATPAAVNFQVPSGDFPCAQIELSAGAATISAFGFLQ